MVMHSEIDKLLRKEPGIKTRVVASRIGQDRSAVNAFRHDNPDCFVKDAAHRWSLVKPASAKKEQHLRNLDGRHRAPDDARADAVGRRRSGQLLQLGP